MAPVASSHGMRALSVGTQNHQLGGLKNNPIIISITLNWGRKKSQKR